MLFRSKKFNYANTGNITVQDKRNLMNQLKAHAAETYGDDWFDQGYRIWKNNETGQYSIKQTAKPQKSRQEKAQQEEAQRENYEYWHPTAVPVMDASSAAFREKYGPPISRKNFKSCKS